MNRTPSNTRRKPQLVPKGQQSAKSEGFEERTRMIAEAAYYRAESRGFTGGDPLQDWLDAEAEIDRILDHKKAG